MWVGQTLGIDSNELNRFQRTESIPIQFAIFENSRTNPHSVELNPHSVEENPHSVEENQN